MIGYIKNALTLCWRVFLCLILIALSSLGAAYAFLPDLKRLQPDLEMVVQQELKLSSLQLGELAWTWGWNLSITSKHTSFSRDDLGVSLKDTRLDIRFALTDILQGHLWPKSMLVQGGEASIRILEGNVVNAWRLPPVSVVLKDVTVHWVWKKEASNFYIQTLNILPALRELRLNSKTFQARMQYDKTFQPTSIKVDFQSLDDLPKVWREHLKGHISGHLEARRINVNKHISWQGEWQLRGHDKAGWRSKKPRIYIPFDRIQGNFSYILSSQGKALEWQWKDILWVQANNKILASLHWKNEHLTLKAASSQLAMPLIWSWLKPVDDDIAWHDWLDTMHSGVAKDVQLSLGLSWNNFPSMPTRSAWKGLKYRIQGDVEDVDISLGESGVLRHTQASLDLNEHALHADIHQTSLPQAVGKVSGSLDIPWNTLAIHLKGKGDVDVALLQAWASSTASLKEFSWLGAAPAKATFSLQWQPRLADFTSLFVHLKPMDSWALQLYQRSVWLDAGELIWDMKTGLRAKSLQLHDDHMQAKVNFSLLQNQSHTPMWLLKSLHGDVQGKLPFWVKHYALPVEALVGHWKTSLHFDGKQWFGDLDLKDAAWKNVLGSQKKKGEPWQLHYEAYIAKQVLHFSKISSQQMPLQLDAYADVSSERIALHMTHLKTAAVQGKVSLDLPLKKGVWQANIMGDYLNRNILPSHLPETRNLKQQPWHVLADVKDIEWGKTRIQGVHLDMSSRGDSASYFKADRMMSKALSLQDIQADFKLLEAGEIDLLKLSALRDNNHISISAILTPEKTGGMAWHGYAQLDGSLGGLMHQAKLSTLLDGGKMRAVLLGQGFIFRDQPWWQGLRGRLRIHSENGQILKGGTLTKFLAVLSWADLPQLLLAYRPDLTRKGLVYEHLRVESEIYNRDMRIQQLALDSSAMQLLGQGSLSLDAGQIDMMLVAQPFQNLDAVLAAVPLLGRVIGGAGHSIFRRAYHVYGPVSDAQVDGVSPEDAGAASSGLIDSLLNIPDALFGGRKKVPH